MLGLVSTFIYKCFSFLLFFFTKGVFRKVIFMKKVNLKVILNYLLCLFKQNKKASDITIIIVKGNNNGNIDVTNQK